jgi:hypothetical protein
MRFLLITSRYVRTSGSITKLIGHRGFYVAALAGFVTYAATRKVPLILISGFFGFMGLFLVVVDLKYQGYKSALECQAIEIGKRIGVKTQFDMQRTKRKMPYWILQVVLMFIVWFTGMIIWFITLASHFDG